MDASDIADIEMADQNIQQWDQSLSLVLPL